MSDCDALSRDEIIQIAWRANRQLKVSVPERAALAMQFLRQQSGIKGRPLPDQIEGLPLEDFVAGVLRGDIRE